MDLVSFLMFFDTFSVRARNLQNLQKHCFYNEFACFYHQKNMIFHDVHDFFDTYFGIDFGCVLASILSPFWHPFGINVRVLGCSFLI